MIEKLMMISKVPIPERGLHVYLTINNPPRPRKFVDRHEKQTVSKWKNTTMSKHLKAPLSQKTAPIIARNWE